jgi:hypothetical protein
VPLTSKTWDVYRQLRDEAIAELDAGTCVVQHAPVMVMRLAQVCSGFLGGLYSNSENLISVPFKELSSEASDGVLTWLKLRLDEDPSFKCVVWSRWRAEIERLNERLISDFPFDFRTGTMWGDVKTSNFLHPRWHGLEGAGVMVCQPQAAQYGVSFAKATTAVFLSQGYSLVARQQCEDRIQAPDTRSHSYLVDVLVTGPKGERTVTHDIRTTLLKKEDVALRTIAGWKKALEVE